MNRDQSNRKFALITGASSGIGAATARKLAKANYSLILVARRVHRLNELKQSLLAEHSQIQVLVASLDLSKKSQIEEFVQKNLAALRQVEALVNNAGFAVGRDSFEKSSASSIDAMVAVNILGLMHLSHALLPGMLEGGKGDIVNIGSVAGRWSYPGAAVYCATKAAVRSFSEGLREDLIGKNIRVMNIEPGMVETEFSQVRLGDLNKARDVYRGMAPLVAEDIADTVEWCLSRPRHVNIQELVIYPTEQASPHSVYRQL